MKLNKIILIFLMVAIGSSFIFSKPKKGKDKELGLNYFYDEFTNTTIYNIKGQPSFFDLFIISDGTPNERGTAESFLVIWMRAPVVNFINMREAIVLTSGGERNYVDFLINPIQTDGNLTMDKIMGSLKSLKNLSSLKKLNQQEINRAFSAYSSHQGTVQTTVNITKKFTKSEITIAVLPMDSLDLVRDTDPKGNNKVLFLGYEGNKSFEFKAKELLAVQKMITIYQENFIN